MTPTLATLTLATPAGDLTVLVDDGVVVASGFTTIADLTRRLGPAMRDRGVRPGPGTAAVESAVRAWLAGDLMALDAVPIRQPGSSFLQDVWRTMRAIPPGRTWSYAELAARAGRPSAVRAAGGACARNLVAPFVPCHRVVRSDGSLGGYAYGLPVKQWLLRHEGALVDGAD